MKKALQLLVMILTLVAEWWQESRKAAKEIAVEKKQNYKERKKAKLDAASSGDARKLTRGM